MTFSNAGMLRCAMHAVPCTLCHARCAMHAVPCTLCHARCAMHAVRIALMRAVWEGWFRDVSKAIDAVTHVERTAPRRDAELSPVKSKVEVEAILNADSVFAAIAAPEPNA